MTWEIGPRDALASAARAAKPQSGGALNAGVISDAKAYDPIYSVEFTARIILYLVFNSW